MAVTISDIITSVKDYTRNQSLTDARAIRAIDDASTLVYRHLGLPGTESEYKFNFLEDQYVYSTPAGFGEPLSLRYSDESFNKAGTFKYRPAEMLFQRIKTTGADTKLFGIYSAGTTNQLWVLAKNTLASMPLDTFDSDNATTWTASNDAESISDDNVTYMEGAGSMRFNINTAASVANRATLTTITTASDISLYLDKGYFRAYTYLANVTDFTSISFNWGSDGSNYYKATVTTQEDGSAFVVGWNNLSFPWLGATVVGTPVPSQITRYWFDYDYAVGYTGGNSFRLDYLRIATPDEMVMTYYTNYKGTASGGSKLTNFTATTDTLLFGDYDPALKTLIALEAAVILNPQILVDDKSVRTLYMEFSTLFKRRYPRKRIMNMLAEPGVARTNQTF